MQTLTLYPTNAAKARANALSARYNAHRAAAKPIPAPVAPQRPKTPTARQYDALAVEIESIAIDEAIRELWGDEGYARQTEIVAITRRLARGVTEREGRDFLDRLDAAGLDLVAVQCEETQ